MNRLIGGKRYDTQAARPLINVRPHKRAARPASLFYFNETLYVKRGGEYFLGGVGGRITPYSYVRWDGSTTGAGIIPLSRQEAIGWALAAYRQHCARYLPERRKLQPQDVWDVFGVDREEWEKLTEEGVIA